ncbi:MAG: DnaJ domain-containing protein [Deltaproteobacteria bacterium]|nr:DnaJ domain-containing protein [Deltaproteobacteria bacterium]
MPRTGSRNDVPRRIGGERIRELPLTPAEGRVLAQIDGLTSVADLELVTGLTADELDLALTRLVELRLIQTGATAAIPVRLPAVRHAVAPPPRRTSPQPPAPESRQTAGPIQPLPADESPAGAADARDADEALSPEERRRIETFLMRAESVDFYRLLGVSRGAERAEIRSAYFGLAKEFHPDAYYGRDIGEARHRLERIFRQITRAYEVLSRAKSRREYDEYIKGQAILQGRDEEEQAWQAEEQRRQTPYGAKATEAARDAAHAKQEAAATRDAATSAASSPVSPVLDELPSWPPPATTPSTTTAATPQPPSPTGAPASEPPSATTPSASTAATPRTVPPPGTPAGVPPSPAGTPAVGARRSAADGWQRLRMARQLASVLRRSGAPEPAKDEKRGTDYLTDAEAAAKNEEWGRVFGLLEAAEKLGLSEAELTRASELRERATRELARISFNQARFSEGTGDLGAALQHAENACRYGPDNAECWDATARLWLRIGRELHKARDAAAKAILLAPQSIAFRMTLIRVYLAAGLPKNARREAEAALALKPDDKQVKALLAEAREQHE